MSAVVDEKGHGLRRENYVVKTNETVLADTLGHWIKRSTTKG